MGSPYFMQMGPKSQVSQGKEGMFRPAPGGESSFAPLGLRMTEGKGRQPSSRYSATKSIVAFMPSK